MSSIKSITKIIILCFLITSSCKNEKHTSDENREHISPNKFTDYLGKKVIKHFTGTIINIDKNPIEGSTITIGNKTTVTDNNGNFELRDVTVNELFAYIEAEKEGYKNNALSIEPNDKINKVIIQLETESELCLFWFCKHNHSLPNSNH